jgi:hypothetical protein
LLELAVDLGQVLSVKIENMSVQYQKLVTGAVSSTLVDDRSSAVSGARQDGAGGAGTSLVSVARGAGFGRLFESLGAVVVAVEEGGPSVAEIVDAIERCEREAVIVLPNDPNVELAVQEAAHLARGRSARVVRTASCSHGLAASLAYSPEVDVDANSLAMQGASERCHCIQLGRAVRAADFDGVAVRTGAVIALIDNRPVVSGASHAEALCLALSHLPDDQVDLFTVYVGADGSQETAASLAALLSAHRGASVEIVVGGQPHYEYLVSTD